MRSPTSSTRKIVGREELASRLLPRPSSRTVVLTNGVFDVFHVGHVRYLEAAAKLGDILVVAVNSDASTRRYKGPDRPMIPEAERAEIVASLECVDWVLIFDEDDVRATISTLKPDVHAKGTDYTKDSVPERELVLAHGGRVEICGDPKDHSSTEILGRLRPKKS